MERLTCTTGFRPEGEMAKRFFFARPTAREGMVTVLDEDMGDGENRAECVYSSGEEAVGTDFVRTRIL